MNQISKVLIIILIIIVLSIYLLKKNKKNTIENFKETTKNEESCYPWSKSVQFKYLANTQKKVETRESYKECRNPENDINGSWCYTDNLGNYDYCDSLKPGCMKLDIIEGCFKPEENQYKLVIYKSQPFEEDYLELGQVIDSFNYIWAIDKGRRSLKITNKKNYINFNGWSDIVVDNLKDYDPKIPNVFFITSIGVKTGGYKDTFNNKSNEEEISSEGSETCYLFLRHNKRRTENKMVKLYPSYMINIQGEDNNIRKEVKFMNDKRQYLDLHKKMFIEKDNKIIGIHREQIHNGKGITWGDLVIGKQNGELYEFNLVGNTFPEKAYKLTRGELSYNGFKNLGISEKRPLIFRSNKYNGEHFFDSKVLYFVSYSLSKLNQILKTNNHQKINKYFDILKGQQPYDDDWDRYENSIWEEIKNGITNYLNFRIFYQEEFNPDNSDDKKIIDELKKIKKDSTNYDIYMLFKELIKNNDVNATEYWNTKEEDPTYIRETIDNISVTMNEPKFKNNRINDHLNYVNDYKNISLFKINRKIEIVKETIKILNEITDMVLNDNMEMGVIDCNVSDKYIYLDIIVPYKSDNAPLSWENGNQSDYISKIKYYKIQLMKDYVTYIYDKLPNELDNLFTFENLKDDKFDLKEKIDIKDTTKKYYPFYRNNEGTSFPPQHDIIELRDSLSLNMSKENGGKINFIHSLLAIKDLSLNIKRNLSINHGKIFIQGPSNQNYLSIYLKNFDSSKSNKENEGIYINIIKNKQESAIVSNYNKIRLLHDNSEKNSDEYPDLTSNEIYNIIPGTITIGTSVFGIMSYNFSNKLYDNDTAEEINKLKINNIKFKKNVLFQLYGTAKGTDEGTAKGTDELKDIGRIELINKINLSFILTSELKYTHGIIYNENGKTLEPSSYYGILYWFYLRRTEKKFEKLKDWIEIYKTIKSEGLYNIGANPQDFGLNITFANQIEELLKSLEDNDNVGKLRAPIKKILMTLKDFKYDKDFKLENNYPQVKLHKLKTKKYGNEAFVELQRFNSKKNEDKTEYLLTLVLDKNSDGIFNKKKNDDFNEKYEEHIHDTKSKLPFDYNYYRLIRVPKIDILSNNSFCETTNHKNRYDSLWKHKTIKDFDEYYDLVIGVREKSNAHNRIRGLYHIHNIYKDDKYYKKIKLNFQKKEDIVKKTINKIIESKEDNLLRGSGYPFMVIYQIRDYKGYPCQEEKVNSEKIFLTYNLDKDKIFNNLEEKINNIIGIKDGPIISEEFLSFTGQGSSIRFYFQKIRGDTPISIDSICDNSYNPIPNINSDCGTGNSCGSIEVANIGLDGKAICGLTDKEVKVKPLTPQSASFPSNVSTNSCDIYKIKGNKKINYTLGKLFGYNDTGKYQLSNQYTLKHGDHYFYYKRIDDKILFKTELNTDPYELSNYAFNLTYGNDDYGMYIMLSPYNGIKEDNAKYLTRVINIYDKHFNEWKLDVKIDNINDKNSFIRNTETEDIKINIDKDVDYYAQKFNLPDDLILRIAEEEGIKSNQIDKMKEDSLKKSFISCNLGEKGMSKLCKGTLQRPKMTLEEHQAILNEHEKQIDSLMKKYDSIPETYFNIPENKELYKVIKSTINELKTAKTFIYKQIKDVNWVVKTQLEKDIILIKKKKNNNSNLEDIFSPGISGSSQEKIDSNTIMEDIFNKMNTDNTKNISNRKCKSINSIETFDNIASKKKNIGGKYFDYIDKELDKKKEEINKMNDNVHNLLSTLNKLSSGMDLSGDNKKMLMSEIIQEKNKLNNYVFKIKNKEQEDRINIIGNKIKALEEDNKKLDLEENQEKNQINNVSIKSIEDGEFLNMYKIEKNKDNNHLLFINGGCLDYNPDKKDLTTVHCREDIKTQQFNIYRMEDSKDLENYKIKNHNDGVDKTFDMIMSQDKKCLHKENGEISLRECNNIKNQHWDYSNITGPCKLE